MVSMPRVIFRDGPDGLEEPYETVTIDCAEPYSGAVIQDLNQRGGELQDMLVDGEIVRIEFLIPSRGLIGYRSRFLTQTRGTGTLYKTLQIMDRTKENFSGDTTVFSSHWRQDKRPATP